MYLKASMGSSVWNDHCAEGGWGDPERNVAGPGSHDWSEEEAGSEAHCILRVGALVALKPPRDFGVGRVGVHGLGHSLQ